MGVTSPQRCEGTPSRKTNGWNLKMDPFEKENHFLATSILGFKMLVLGSLSFTKCPGHWFLREATTVIYERKSQTFVTHDWSMVMVLYILPIHELIFDGTHPVNEQIAGWKISNSCWICSIQDGGFSSQLLLVYRSVNVGKYASPMDPMGHTLVFSLLICEWSDGSVMLGQCSWWFKSWLVGWLLLFGWDAPYFGGPSSPRWCRQEEKQLDFFFKLNTTKVVPCISFIPMNLEGLPSLKLTFSPHTNGWQRNTVPLSYWGFGLFSGALAVTVDGWNLASPGMVLKPYK